MQIFDTRNSAAFAGYGHEDLPASGGTNPSLSNVTSGAQGALPRGMDVRDSGVNGGVFDVYALLKLFSVTAQRTRTACRNMRQSELDAFQGAAESAAVAIREAGRQRFIGSVVGGIASGIGGIAQMGIGIHGLKQTAQATKLQQEAVASEKLASAELTLAASETPNVDIHRGNAERYAEVAQSLREESQKCMSKSYAVPLLGSAASGLVNGVAQAGKGVFDWRAADEDANRLNFETQSRICENRMQAEEKVMQDRYGEMHDLREKLSSIEQTRLESNRTVARNL
jgi:hypothetical protein